MNEAWRLAAGSEATALTQLGLRALSASCPPRPCRPGHSRATAALGRPSALLVLSSTDPRPHPHPRPRTSADQA